MNTQQYHFCVDGYEANQENRVGSNVFAFEILWGLAELTAKEPNARVTVVLPRPALPSLPKPSERWQYQVVTPTQFWTQWALPLHIFRHRKQYSAFFTPSHYAPRFCAVPYISSVMDT
ncbi:hypothetical protein KBC79_06480, partial [Candidatus Woesebacteria bacterium]|nr:hypothetical protein [Candidatus Woesebacteria bacterium]